MSALIRRMADRTGAFLALWCFAVTLLPVFRVEAAKNLVLRGRHFYDLDGNSKFDAKVDVALKKRKLRLGRLKGAVFKGVSNATTDNLGMFAFVRFLEQPNGTFTIIDVATKVQLLNFTWPTKRDTHSVLVPIEPAEGMTTVAPRSTSSKTAIPRSSTTKVTTLSRTITRTETKTTLTASKTKTKTSKTTSRPGTTKTFTNAKGTTQTTATTTTRLCETPDVEPGHYALQAAINSTDDGGVVCLKEGTFTNALVAYNPPIAHIMKNITIIGAGPGKTIIDGQSKHLGFLIGFGDYTSAIAVTISQLTVQSTRHNIWGNGVMIYGRSGMRVTISDVVFRNCTRTAAIRQASLKNGLPFTRLERVNITGGATASNGFPGAYYGDGETVMVDSHMIGNFVNGSGGAIALKAGASLVMNGGSIVGNVASNTFGSLGHGGAFMSLVGAVNISLTGVVVKDNYANASGGLAYLNGDSTLTLSGCTLANNTAMGGCNCVYRNGTNPGCDTSFCS